MFDALLRYDLGKLSPRLANVDLGVNATNLFDKKPPLPLNPGTFNTFADTYNVLGRTFGLSATYKY